MRDEQRIGVVMKWLDRYWHDNPDLRLGQIIVNIADEVEKDPYYIEDDVLARELEMRDARRFAGQRDA